LERDIGLPRAGRHREQYAALAVRDRLDGALDRDLLVIARLFAGGEIRRNEQPAGRVIAREFRGKPEARPEFIREREGVDL
jgi:hypothetical protein